MQLLHEDNSFEAHPSKPVVLVDKRPPPSTSYPTFALPLFFTVHLDTHLLLRGLQLGKKIHEEGNSRGQLQRALGMPFSLRAVGAQLAKNAAVCSDMADWRRFGRAPDFSGRKMKGVIAKTTGMSDDAEGFGQGSVNPASAATTGSSLNAWHRRHRM